MKKEIFETNNYRLINKICDQSRFEKSMLAIIGIPGIGKTTALVDYAARNKNTFYIRVRKSMSTKDFYVELLAAISHGEHERDLTINFILNKIQYILKTRKNSLLLVDETGRLTNAQMGFIHEMRDLTENSTGIILAGPSYFQDNLEKWKRLNVVGIPEVYRRIEEFYELSNVMLGEVTAICRHYRILNKKDIKKIYKSCESFSDVFNSIKKFLREEKEFSEKISVI